LLLQGAAPGSALKVNTHDSWTCYILSYSP
jgi:hypothetical protein